MDKAPDIDVPARADEWDRFVAAHPASSLYHTWRWSEFASRVFGFEVYRLTHREPDGQLDGVLPLVLQRSRLFGRRLVSLPFFNYGGPLGLSPEVEAQLAGRAADLARQVGARTLELRCDRPLADFPFRQDKVTVELELPDDEDSLARALGAKLRSQIRRADREQPHVESGGPALLDDFYTVFAATMRDLGTPVYPRRFFDDMLASLADDCSVVVVRVCGRPAAVALLTHFRDRTEIPWAASLHALRSTSVNMRLYWECLKLAIGRGSRIFDFGRSTVDAGTYKFKLQWGGTPRPLYWAYPLDPTAAGGRAGEGRLRRYATQLWSRLPLGLASRLGPMISPGLPW